MKDKSSVLDRLLKRINDPGYQEKMNKRREEYKKSLTSEFQFGFFVGEEIVHRHLPTLSVEASTNKIVQVSDEDEMEYKRLESEWYENHKQHEAEKEWEIFQNFRKSIKTKYLPNPLECHLTLLNIHDMDEFKKGLIGSLWDCDSCNYSLKPEDIEITDLKDYFSVIKFKLD